MWKNEIQNNCIFCYKSMSKKGHNLVKIQDRVMSSCLEVGLMVTNKYVKCQCNTSKGIWNMWGGAKNLTKCDADAAARVSRIALLLYIIVDLKMSHFRQKTFNSACLFFFTGGGIFLKSRGKVYTFLRGEWDLISAPKVMKWGPWN